ncbi:triphosphoribosyl-dephospho-CoA synthase [Pyrococcus yayanosii]|uniref:ATP:dephospho-CoA triphosphoribosyl transferase n=1 Tax=Pyrococcus yayanosii (strain CH1 / JCM 16557) TaxID=529709 RepID=F8AG76_PYRYC|nr:triphosphoribosyl-dephospho-CoA synthase [Pyrococcus yayanosii]AEH23912.1 ATP:dephospho-CoA triphosphoribosyl transferase [Pyrococcus yayanosii CH1]
MDPWEVVKAFVIGPLLEATVPKPGNVSRRRDFNDLTLYHFIFASPAWADVLREAVLRGKEIAEGRRPLEEANIGRFIRTAVEKSKAYQDANPNFGVITLSVPLVVALPSGGVEGAGKIARTLIEASTPEDSIELYRAIRIANPKGIPKGVKYDVYSDESFEELRRDGVNLLRLAEMSCERELIFCEWLNCYSLVYKTFGRLEELVGEKPLEEAVLWAFLELLAEREDTLILRKAGPEEARLVRERACAVLLGEMTLEDFERFMEERGDLRNPGSLADIMAVTLSLLLLKGYRLRGRWLVIG